MLGIDVSKDQLACALFDRPAEKFRWERAVPNTGAWQSYQTVTKAGIGIATFSSRCIFRTK